MIVNGHDLYVEQHGPPGGLPVLLLHHGLGASRSWKAQVPALSEAGYRVTVYDRWGYGRSELRVGLGQPDFAADVADLKALLEVLGIERPVLVGHSDGGTIALIYAAHHPEQKLTALVTVAAHIYVEPKMKQGIRSIQHELENDLIFQERFFRLHGDKWEQVFRNWYEGWIRPDNLDWDLRPALRSVRYPVLVIQGEEDEHATPQHARDLSAALPNAELWLEPDGSHKLPRDMPEEFNRRLLGFLSQVGKSKERYV